MSNDKKKEAAVHHELMAVIKENPELKIYWYEGSWTPMDIVKEVYTQPDHFSEHTRKRIEAIFTRILVFEEYEGTPQDYFNAEDF